MYTIISKDLSGYLKPEYQNVLIVNLPTTTTEWYRVVKQLVVRPPAGKPVRTFHHPNNATRHWIRRTNLNFESHRHCFFLLPELKPTIFSNYIHPDPLEFVTTKVFLMPFTWQDIVYPMLILPHLILLQLISSPLLIRYEN